MINKDIAVNFSWRTVIFFICLETLTVPLVAMSNQIVIQNILLMAIMGFGVAFICILILLRFLKKIILRNSQRIFGFEVSKISGIWYLGILAGILEMVMFLVQDILFSHGCDDYRVGFISAFVSVAVTLIIYQIGVKLFSLAIKIRSQDSIFVIQTSVADILKLALLFGCYEFIVCPITGWWIPYQGLTKLFIAIASGVIGGASGGLLLIILTRLFRCLMVKFQLRQL